MAKFGEIRIKKSIINWLVRTNKFTLEVKEKLKNRFQVSELNYYYALHTLKGRYVEGEEEISKNSFWSVCYVNNVLKGRFELGEKIIANSNFDLNIKNRIEQDE